MTAPHYGKRNLGLGTAASPGDTLHFNFASYNDSGDSEVLSGLAVTDIEVIKDGVATVRATDSGYSLISDTGMVGDRAGLYRCSIQLYNTADDASFYANGSWYQAFVDAVTIDGKTVRFWLGSWEIGEPRANVVQLGGDTGALGWLKTTFAAGFADTGINDRLGRIGFDVDTGLRAQISDVDTGLHDTIADLDTGLRPLLAAQDTGMIANAVWNALRADHVAANTFGQWVKADLRAAIGVSLNADTGLHIDDGRLGVSTKALSDTGVNERFARIQSDVDTGLRTHIDDLDTGLANLNVNVHMLRGDTGGADRFYRYTQKLDTGGDATVSSSVDTGVVNQAVWQGNATRVLTANTNLGGLAVNVTQVVGDTGAGVHLKRIVDEYDTGRLAAEATATLDTGAVNQAVWQTNAQRKLTVDTGIADQVWMQARSAYTADTGTFGEHLGGSLGTAVVDTGVVNQAVWQANASRTITSFDVDTGLRDLIADRFTELDTGLRALLALRDTGAIATAVWAGDTGLRAILALQDTGAISNAVWNALRADHLVVGSFGQWVKADLRAVVGVELGGDTGTHFADGRLGVNVLALSDTGVNQRLGQIQSDVDTGLRAQIADADTGLHDAIADLDTGLRALLALADTGRIATAVWAGDTGLRDHITNVDTGLTNLLALRDTGAIAAAVWSFASRGITASSDTGLNSRFSQVGVTAIADTGLNERLDAIENKTNSLTFTVAGVLDANIQAVNDVTIAGTGDTGTGNTWRPA